MTFTPEQTKALQAPLDPRHVKPPPQGKYGEYVDSHHVLSEANRIFGFDGWGYTITRLDLCTRVEGTDRNGNPQVRVGYRCTVQATAGGVVKEGAAVGTGMAKPENEADAHESAVKEAETDALKRALRSFGNTFGLALYDKTKADVQAPPPPTINEEQRLELMTLLDGAKLPVSAVLKKARENTGLPIPDLRDLPVSELDGIRTAALNRTQKEPVNA